MTLLHLLRKIEPIDRCYNRIYAQGYRAGTRRGYADKDIEFFRQRAESEAQIMDLMTALEELCRERDFFKKQAKSFAKLVPAGRSRKPVFNPYVKKQKVSEAFEGKDVSTAFNTRITAFYKGDAE